jgi:2,4-dienoyl-CoA reductase (NADPH2)
MGSMHTRLDTLDRPVDRQAAFYAARARGGVALVITGGVAPNAAGRMEEDAAVMATAADAEERRPIVDAVHAQGALIVMQILHAGAYAKLAAPVGPGAYRAPINANAARALSTEEVEQTIADHVRAAVLAGQAGFDGVEVMGSEGYLIAEFAAPRTNQRTDRFGGDIAGRGLLASEIVRRIRARTGPGFLIVFRISALDLIEGGNTGAEIAALAQAIEAAGADALDTGIGWHEAQVPTIAYPVPRAAFAFATRALKRAVGIPVMATNRINTPEMAEALLADGTADLVSLARPLLADPDFVAKAAAGRADEIAPCIACNQACLDYIFGAKPATCLVNPRAGREAEDWTARSTRRRVAVVGSGPAGLAAATEAAAAGHSVTLFEAGVQIGGQLLLAREVPGKGEFDGLLAYFHRRLEVTGVELRLGVRADAAALAEFDAVILASGIVPRMPDIPGIGHPKVVAYADVLTGRATVGGEVAIIGMGGIAVDVAEFLAGGDEDFQAVWGIDPAIAMPGGLVPARAEAPARRVTLFQRSRARPGERLGKSTFWIHRLRMRARGVGLVGGVAYIGIDDAGLHYVRDGVAQLHPCDTVVVCAGQEPDDGLAAELPCQVVGGARLAGEIDALRAIEEGTRAALAL